MQSLETELAAINNIIITFDHQAAQFLARQHNIRPMIDVSVYHANLLEYSHISYSKIFLDESAVLSSQQACELVGVLSQPHKNNVFVYID